MAQRVVTQLVSDLSGDEMEEGAGETIDFTYRGVAYTIDLTEKEAKGFDKSIAMYLEHATKVSGGRGGRRSQSSNGASSSGRSKEELANIRSWATENGFEVSARGRIKQEIVDAYHAAN